MKNIHAQNVMKFFQQNDGYINHVKYCAYNKNSKFKCNICGKCFNTETTLSSHYKLFHQDIYEQYKHDKRYNEIINNGNKVTVCPICNTMHEGERGLTNHMRILHTKAYKSYLNDKKYSIEQQHINDKQTLECPICKKHFKCITRHLIKKHDMSLEEIDKLVPRT